MTADGLSIPEVLRLSSIIASSMLLIFASTCAYYLERKSKHPPMLALLFLLIGWCSLALGAATSGIGRFFPAILVAAPLCSGYIGPTLFIYTRQLTTPHHPASLKWLFLGAIGTSHSVLALLLPDGLDPAIQSIIHKTPYIHPILSPIMMLHGLQLISFVIFSTFLITRAYINKTRPDLRRRQFWLMTICWTCLVIIVFTNILPTVKVIITEIQPALITLPIAFVGALSIKALGEESSKNHDSRIHERDLRMDSLGRMARGMAHDLNNILSTILGHAEIARMKNSPEQPTQSHLNQIIFGAKRAAMLIERMQAYSGKRRLAAKEIVPTEQIKSLFRSVATLQPAIVSMQLELADNLPLICMDETELDSTIHNLLQNSLNALRGGKGKITLRGSYEAITKLPLDFVGNDVNDVPCMRIEVEDTGDGMSPEEASRALEPFFSTHANGKGLGLVNVLSAIKGAGGALWFQSKQHSGTRFTFWIPAASTISQAQQPNRTQSPENLRLLLVEDEGEVAEVMLEMLGNMQIQTQHYTKSEEVLQRLQNQTLPAFDAAILDVRLGKLDGIELGHHLMNEHNLTTLLFISGDEPGQRIQQFEGRNVQFLRKPITIAQLQEALHKLNSGTP